MISVFQLHQTFFSHRRETETLATSHLLGHDEASKQHALEAVKILIKYKASVHDFTDEIIEHWTLPKRVMLRYHFDEVEQLNEWLDNIS